MIDEIIDSIKAIYPNRYIDKYDIDPSDPIDPLQYVIPTKDKPFGGFSLNIVVFTDDYVDWDDQIEDSKQKLIDEFDNFAYYETHFIIAEDVSEASDMISDLTDLCDELEEQNCFFQGQLGDGEMESKIKEIIKDFHNKCHNLSTSQSI